MSISPTGVAIAMAETFTHDVFLSHAPQDKPVVRELAERLKRDGLRVWLDEWELRPGDSRSEKIEKGLERSRMLVLCMSEHTFGSEWARLEAGTFRFRDPLNQERRFLPLRLGPSLSVRMESRLSRLLGPHRAPLKANLLARASGQVGPQ